MTRCRLPLWMKLLYTVLVAVVLPVYWVKLGPSNFLWFSDTALIVMLPTVWAEARRPASMMATLALPFELAWNAGFLLGLVLGHDPIGFAGYMFDPQEPVLIRTLSGCFHVALPITLIYCVARLGYDRRAFWYQLPVTWLLLLLSYVLAPAADNINFVHRLGHGEDALSLPQPWHLLALMVGLPALVQLPTHALLAWWRGGRGDGVEPGHARTRRDKPGG